MRIAWLAPYPIAMLTASLVLSRRPGVAHAASWIVNLSRAIANHDGFELHLITLTPRVPCDQTLRHDNITFHVLKNGIPLINRGFPWWLPLDLLFGFRGDSKRLASEVAKIEPDIVHAHGTESAYSLGALASGYPCLISIQGIVTEYRKTNPSFASLLFSRLEQAQVHRGKYFGCRTPFDKNFVRRLNPQAKIFELQEAMAPVFFEEEWKVNDNHRILFVGSLEERKGALFLIEALALVKSKLPRATLTLIGVAAPAYLTKLKTRAYQLGVINDIRFPGHLTPEEIAREHHKTQVFVLPTLNDNSPNALAEAMVSGMPVIASAVGGVPSMIRDGETGVLTPPADPKALAEQIVRLLTQNEERARLGRNARAVASIRHKPQKVAQETIAAYEKILELERGNLAKLQTTTK